MTNYLTSYKRRKIDPEKKIQVYRNLNGDSRRRWSIRQGGLVRAHAEELQISIVRFKVSPSGWKRMVKSGKRNVHAYAEGYIIQDSLPYWAGDFRYPIRYNRTNGEFQDEGGTKVVSAQKAHFGTRLSVEAPRREVTFQGY